MKDPTASSRKSDHIDLAFQSQVESLELDSRFYYEPMLSGHPIEKVSTFSFLERSLKSHIWVSSMTGGTEKAKMINENLARACCEFGMGMGLGSCRSLLDSDEFLGDFNVRPVIGPDLPLFANLGIAQVEDLVRNVQTDKIISLIEKLQADGLIIHVNPLQEWLQPEGDVIHLSPIETIQKLIAVHPGIKMIVKEVGQGMGKGSLEALMQLPLAAIEFAAHGGTNFSKLELLRNGSESRDHYADVSRIGHSAVDMVEMINDIRARFPVDLIKCNSFIISGGVRNFIDGYYLTQKLNATAVYGQASTLLRHAAISYEELQHFLKFQLKGFAMAESFLRIRQ